MIRLTKLAKPQILQDNEARWTAIIVDKVALNEVPTQTEKTRYRHPQIKAALVQETRGKCAYCESKFLHVHHGDVEHIYPKSLAPEKTVVWENLTLACEIWRTPAQSALSKLKFDDRSYLCGNRLPNIDGLLQTRLADVDLESVHQPQNRRRRQRVRQRTDRGP
jgi:uncharacterized protein (TIGR02646 family)